MNVRRAIFRAIRRTGYELHRSPLHGTLESELERVFRTRSVETVLDVGANEGQFGRSIREIGFKGRIVSFEPGSIAFRRLENQLDDNWEAHQLALGDQTASLELLSFGDTQLSSLHSPSPWGVVQWGLHADASEVVRVRRLDDVVPELAISLATTFVKIDTQGHDLAVARGGWTSLASVAGLQMELPTYHIYEGAPEIGDVFAAAEELGLALIGLFPVQRDLVEHLVPIEFDALFVRPHHQLWRASGPKAPSNSDTRPNP